MVYQGNDNRFSSLLIICLVVISNVLPRIVNWFLGGLLFFAFISINARGAIISLILWPILEEIFKRTHDQRARVALGMLLYFIFCVGYFAMIHILEDKSSNIRVGLGVDVLVSMSVFQFASVKRSHFSLISFFQYFGPFLFIILFLLFWFFGGYPLLIALISCSFVSDIFAVPWLLYAYVIYVSRHGAQGV